MGNDARNTIECRNAQIFSPVELAQAEPTWSWTSEWLPIDLSEHLFEVRKSDVRRKLKEDSRIVG
jgi:hypothetical protein